MNLAEYFESFLIEEKITEEKAFDTILNNFFKEYIFLKFYIL